MKSFDISYFINKKSRKTLKSGGEKVREAWEATELISDSIRKVKISRKMFIMVACLMVSLLMGVNDYINSFFHIVYFDGEEIGLVRETEDVDDFVDDFIERKSREFDTDIFTDAKITFSDSGYHFRGIVEMGVIKEIIDSAMSYYAWAYLVSVDGKAVVHLECEEDLQEILDSVKRRYIPARRDVNILSVETQEKVKGEWVKADPANIMSLGEAFLLFDPYGSDGRIYLASRGYGDRGSYNSSGDESPYLEEASEGSSPILTVVSVEELKEEEEIPFETKYVYNNEVEIGKSETLSPGKVGIKERTYHLTRENGREVKRDEVSAEITREPEERVIEQGSKLLQVNNSINATGAGTGQFIWPVPYSYDNGGKISRGFAGGHSGVDIHANTLTSTPIVASDSGTVIMCQYYGGYGNTIVISHGSYYTLYAHNSSMTVSVGDNVSKGSVIAYMGNTGQTYGRTGIHLHFEIRAANGGWQQSSPLNPMPFF